MHCYVEDGGLSGMSIGAMPLSANSLLSYVLYVHPHVAMCAGVHGLLLQLCLDVHSLQ